MDTHTVQMNDQDAWAALAFIQAKPTEELSRYIWGTKLSNKGEALFSDYLELVLKLAHTADVLSEEDGPDIIDVELTLAELWTLVFAIPQTSYPGARRLLLRLHRGIAELTQLQVWQEPLSEVDMQEIARLVENFMKGAEHYA